MLRSTFGDAAVTSHAQATQAAMEILAGGGNAIDAAVAANAVLGVIAPEMCGVGGDLFALVHRPGLSQPLALNASGPAGSGADPSELKGRAEMPPDHPLSVTIPGCVDGWGRLVGEYGRMSLSDILVPAIRLAVGGFPASPELSRSLTERSDELAPQPASDGLYPGGRAPAPGARLFRPGLGRTLSEMASDGPQAFYGGFAGRSISEATGGRITMEDLTGYAAEWVEPLGIELFGRTAWTVPPNSQGYVTLAALWIFSQLDAPRDPSDPAYHHAMIEAYRAAVFDRDEVLADPDFAGVASAELLAPKRLAPRVGAFDPAVAGSWPPPTEMPGGTTFLAVVDRDGIAVSLIQSNYHGLGSGIGAGSAGFVLHNRGLGFTLDRDHPNSLAPGKRPRHTLAPTLWTRHEQLDLVLGTRGGNQQPQLLTQVAAHLAHAEQTPHAAQQMPRWTLSSFGPGEGSHLHVESGLPSATLDGLGERGHRVEQRARYEESFGPVAVIAVDPGGLRTAAADPRVTTSSAAVR